MATILTDSSNYENIADSIRAINGENTQYYPNQMAAAISELSPKGAVLYTEQSLNTDQQAQARANIGAVSQVAVDEMSMYMKQYTDNAVAEKANVVHSHDDVYYTEAEMDAALSNKQDKNLIVTYQQNSTTSTTHNLDEICDAAEIGVEVKFFDGYEYLNLLEHSRSQGFAVFYVDYFDMNNVLTIKYIVVGTNGDIMMSDNNTYNLAYKEDLNAKQDTLTGTEGQVVQIDSSGKAIASELKLITVDEIDAICGGAISYAEDVMF